jgi:hypothetical protein
VVGTKRTEAFEGVVNLFPEIISRDADMAPWEGAIAQFELWLRKGFGFVGAWTVCEQNQLLSVCFGLPQVHEA